MKPLLQNLYRTRATAYQKAVRSFVEGYREGLTEQPADSGDQDPQLQAQKVVRPVQPTKAGSAKDRSTKS